MLPLRNALLLFGAALIAVGSAEITSRVDDAIRYGVPFWRTPDRERDLTMRDSLGLRGRPNGRYQKWILNRYGFRSPPMSALPRAGCPRIMILGASETLGYYESPGQEYPAQLADSLRRRMACVEVVNAAVAGLSLPGVQELWENWASRFRPAVVVVYPSPAFYLSNRGPSAPAPVRSSSVIQDRRPWRPRLWQRAKDAFEFPEFIQRRRLAAALEAATASHDSTWFFREVPQDRLERYRADLTSLTRSITARGARPVLVTHAMRFHIPPTPDEMPILNGWRRFTPRALPTVMLEFEVAAARVTGQVARSEEVPLVDAAGRLSSHPGWFADFAHFTDEGAAVMAGLLADSLARVIPLR